MSRFKQFLSDKKTDITMVTIAFFLIALINFPSLINMSIDDVGAYTHPDPYKKFIYTWGQWKRYISLLSTNTFAALHLPIGAYFTLGWIMSILGLSIFLAKLMKFMAPSLGFIQRLGLILLAALFPYMFIVFHFKLIGMSVCFVFLALFGIIWSTDRKLWVQLLFSMLAVIIIAGSYQSGLYWLMFTLTAVGIRKTINGESTSDILKWGIYILTGLILGLLVYTFIGAMFEASGIKPKHSIAAINDMATLAKRNISPSFLKFHIRDMPMFPTWLKQLSILHVMILWSTLMFLHRRNLNAYMALPIYLLALFLGVIQILMIPYNYAHIPPRSFWFLGLAYAIIAASTLSSLKAQVGAFWRWAYKLNSVFVIVIACLFAFNTTKFSYGLMNLRQDDMEQVLEIGEKLKSIQVRADDQVAFFLGDSTRIKNRHKHVTGAVRTLFWAPWTRTHFLEYATGIKVKDAPKAAYDHAKAECPKIQNSDNPLVVERYKEYVIICLP